MFKKLKSIPSRSDGKNEFLWKSFTTGMFRMINYSSKEIGSPYRGAKCWLHSLQINEKLGPLYVSAIAASVETSSRFLKR